MILDALSGRRGRKRRLRGGDGLDLKQVRLANFLPGLIVAPILIRLFDAARAAFP